MNPVILDGKKTGKEIREELALKTAQLKEKYGRVPGLAVILVGNDNASSVYVRNKKLACDEVGFYSEVYTLPEETTEEEVLSLIGELNSRNDIHGILVQMPLPRHISPEKVISAISPLKDVDAFSEQNTGKIMIGNYAFLPCTPAGIMALLERYGISPAGKNAVVIGRSNIVGKPMSMLLLHANATVTICHSRTVNLSEITKIADILVSAVGKAGFVSADMVKEGAVVIDVGMNRNSEGRLCGDVLFDEVKEKASYITPVPGGVGPMTITMLMKNTLTAFLMTV